MTTITENTTIKKAEEVLEATRVTKVDELEESLESYNKRLDSMHEKNESLQSKLDIIKSDSVQIVVPQELITKAVDVSVIKLNHKYLETIAEGQSLLDELRLDEIKDILSSIKKNKYDIEVSAEDIKDLDYEIENIVNNELDYKDYCTSSDVDEMIEDAINPDDYITTSEHNQEYRELESKVNELSVIIDNKQVNIIKRLYNWIKSLFTPNKND